MNAKTLFAATFIALAGSAAMAQEITVDTTPIVSTMTRAQVQAEVGRARTNGHFEDHGIYYARSDFAPTGSSKSRSDVKQEVAQARAAGKLDNSGELYGVDFATTAGGKTRAEVKAEVVQAVNGHARLSQGERG